MEKTFHKDFETVYKAAKRAVKAIGWEIEYQNFEEGLMEVSSSASLLSWGESIDIKIEKIDKNSTKAIVKSASNAQLFSWGKNESNEEKFINKLKSILMK